VVSWGRKGYKETKMVVISNLGPLSASHKLHTAPRSVAKTVFDEAAVRRRKGVFRIDNRGAPTPRYKPVIDAIISPMDNYMRASDD